VALYGDRPSSRRHPRSTGESAVNGVWRHRRTRAGTKKITAAVGPAEHLHSGRLALRQARPTKILIEAINNDLFIKHGKPPIA
jgi:hypothetical protein